MGTISDEMYRRKLWKIMPSMNGTLPKKIDYGPDSEIHGPGGLVARSLPLFIQIRLQVSIDVISKMRSMRMGPKYSLDVPSQPSTLFIMAIDIHCSIMA